MAIREDHNRFRDIIRGKIKESFRRYITQDDMIGKQENDLVKIPIPHIDIPRFRYGPKQSGGVGQGDGQSGDPIKRPRLSIPLHKGAQTSEIAAGVLQESLTPFPRRWELGLPRNIAGAGISGRG